MKVTADHIVETHHFTRHIALSGGPVVKMRKQPISFRVSHIHISWDANNGKQATIMVRGPQVKKKGKRFKNDKQGSKYCRRSFNNPQKLPKWLLSAILEGAKLNADTAQRKHVRAGAGSSAVPQEQGAMG